MWFSTIWRWFFATFFALNLFFAFDDILSSNVHSWTFVDIAIALLMAVCFVDNELKPRRPY